METTTAINPTNENPFAVRERDLAVALANVMISLVMVILVGVLVSIVTVLKLRKLAESNEDHSKCSISVLFIRVKQSRCDFIPVKNLNVKLFGEMSPLSFND